MKGICFSISSVFALYGPGAPSSADPPKIPGEYRILDKNGNIKYIGETNNLKRRTQEHQRRGEIEEGDKVLWKKADPLSTSEERRKHEKKKIKQHQPYENMSKGGEGRKPDYK